MPRINLDGTLSEYKISDIDTTGTTQYFGFVDRYGNWYILRLTDNAARYARGSAHTSYEDAWNNRASLAYGNYNEVF